MADRLKDRIAIVTGGSSGIGKAIALKLAAVGARVVVSDIQDTGVAEEITSSHGPDKAIFVKCDVTQESEIIALIQKTVEFGGRLDILVNSAGIAIETRYEGKWPKAHELDTNDFDHAWALNVRGSWLCCKHSITQMLKQEPREPNARGDRTKGRIVNVASALGLVAMAGLPAYVTTKHAVVGMTKQMAADYAKDKIHVNAVCPGFVKTPMISKATDNPLGNALLESLHPWGALGESGDIADAAIFLCSDEAAWVTGHALAVDGAYTAV